MGRLKRDALKINLPYVVADRDRHGNVRLYYWRKGRPKIRLRADPGSAAFMAEVEAAKAASDSAAPKSAQDIAPASLRALCLDYFASTACCSRISAARRTRGPARSAARYPTP